MSLDQYLALPEEKPYLQYWDGVVVQKAVPKRKHGILQSELTTALRAYARVAGGNAWTEAHVWFHGHGYLVPDVCYWGPLKPQGDDDRSLPPTLAVEIRSKDESLRDQRRKCRNMRANGVDVCWFIDPQRWTAERFDGDADGETVPADGVLESAHLRGSRLVLAELFAAAEA
jgi:Uma2 family endonuclease